MRTFTVLDAAFNTVACGEEIEGNIYRVYMPHFEGGHRDFNDLSELLEIVGGYALQTHLFPMPKETQQLHLFGEQTDSD